MKKCVYVLRDSVTGAYGEIFEGFNDAAVVRSFGPSFRHYRESGIPTMDIEILRLATVDYSGIRPLIEPLAAPVVVMRGNDFTPENSDNGSDLDDSDAQAVLAAHSDSSI